MSFLRGLGAELKCSPGTCTDWDDTQITSDGAATFGYGGTGNRTNAGYATSTGNRMTNDGVWTYTHDAEGNLSKKSKAANDETCTYCYNNKNMLIGVEKRATDGGALQLRASYMSCRFQPTTFPSQHIEAREFTRSCA